MSWFWRKRDRYAEPKQPITGQLVPTVVEPQDDEPAKPHLDELLEHAVDLHYMYNQIWQQYAGVMRQVHAEMMRAPMQRSEFVGGFYAERKVRSDGSEEVVLRYAGDIGAVR